MAGRPIGAYCSYVRAPRYTGPACVQCGSFERYKSSGECINCKRIKQRRQKRKQKTAGGTIANISQSLEWQLKVQKEWRPTSDIKST
jgi:hypothetical protein